MLIGTPLLLSARLRLANGNAFAVRREGEGIYLREALLNGKKLEFPRFTVREMMAGGELVLRMRETPAGS